MEGKRRTVDYISGTDFEPGFRFGTPWTNSERLPLATILLIDAL